MRGHAHTFAGSFPGFTNGKAWEHSAFTPAPSTSEQISYHGQMIAIFTTMKQMMWLTVTPASLDSSMEI